MDNLMKRKLAKLSFSETRPTGEINSFLSYTSQYIIDVVAFRRRHAYQTDRFFGASTRNRRYMHCIDIPTRQAIILRFHILCVADHNQSPVRNATEQHYKGVCQDERSSKRSQM